MQSKKNSLIEGVINTFIGLVTTLIFSPLIYRICGVKITVGEMSLATALFTALSVARNYLIRRWFNKEKVNE